MPPQRNPLTPISGNKVKGGELSRYERGLIVGASIGGLTPREIEVEFNASRGAVRRTLELQHIRQDGASLSRAGARLKYSARDRRALLVHIRKYPKATFDQRREDLGLKMSNTYIKDLCKLHGITHWRAKKRPELKQEHADARLLWCQCRAHWDEERWKDYMWSDECSAERGRGKVVEWVFGTPAQKWDPALVTTYKKGKDIRVMVWGAFWGDGKRTPLFIMNRDFESKKHGYSAESYLEVLDEMVLPYYEEGLIFMQDNAPIHTAKKVKRWFDENGIRTTDWPPYSPDLNPIENAWWALKRKMMEMFPDFSASSGSGEEDIKQLEECLKAAWDALDDDFFIALVESMPRRIQACIEAKGWHTKY
jgi:hypothetical protein